jgi:hypothetical protein
LVFLRRPPVILSIYVAFLVVKVVTFLQSSQYRTGLMWVHLIGFVLVAVFSFLAVKGWRPALWIMGIYLMAHIGTVALGIFFIQWEQYILKPFAIVAGSYFAFGGVMLIQQARKPEKAKSEHLVLLCLGSDQGNPMKS